MQLKGKWKCEHKNTCSPAWIALRAPVVQTSHQTEAKTGGLSLDSACCPSADRSGPEKRKVLVSWHWATTALEAGTGLSALQVFPEQEERFSSAHSSAPPVCPFLLPVKRASRSNIYWCVSVAGLQYSNVGEMPREGRYRTSRGLQKNAPQASRSA